MIIGGLDKPNGLEIKEELESYYVNEINHGRLYPNLDTLVEDELLEKSKADERTNTYTLTEKGEQALRERHEWEGQYYDFD